MQTLTGIQFPAKAVCTLTAPPISAAPKLWPDDDCAEPSASTHTRDPAHCCFAVQCCQGIHNNPDIMSITPGGEREGFGTAALRHETLTKLCELHAPGRRDGFHFLYWKHIRFPSGVVWVCTSKTQRLNQFKNWLFFVLHSCVLGFHIRVISRMREKLL